MKEHILSIDPSTKNTGFVLWKLLHDTNCNNDMCQDEICSEIRIENKIPYEPIWVSSYNFKKFNMGFAVSKSDAYYNNLFNHIILNPIRNYLNISSNQLFYNLDIYSEWDFYNFDFVGNIFGLFDKWLTNDMLITSNQWQTWYKEYELINTVNHEIKINKKWNKELSIKLANMLININKWNIDIKDNNNIADSLLIGWYVINKGVKNE